MSSQKQNTLAKGLVLYVGKVNDYGLKPLKVYKDGSVYKVETPYMLTWGADEVKDMKTKQGTGRYTASLQFPNEANKTKETDEFLEELKEIEKILLDEIKRDSLKYLGKKMKPEVIQETYSSFLRYKKNKDTDEFDYSSPPTFNFKIPYYDGKWKCEVYDNTSKVLFSPNETNGKTPLDFITKKSTVKCILICNGFNFSNSKLSRLSWSLHQIVVEPAKTTRLELNGQCMINIDKKAYETAAKAFQDEDEEPLEETKEDSKEVAKPVTKKEVTKEVPKKEVVSKKAVELSDNEDEEDIKPVTKSAKPLNTKKQVVAEVESDEDDYKKDDDEEDEEIKPAKLPVKKAPVKEVTKAPVKGKAKVASV